MLTKLFIPSKLSSSQCNRNLYLKPEFFPLFLHTHPRAVLAPNLQLVPTFDICRNPLLPSIPFTNPSPFQFQKVGCRVVLKLHRRLNTVLFYGTGMPGSESSPALLGASTVVVALHVAEMPKGGIPTRKNTLALSWLCGEPWLTEVEAMVKDLSARVLSRQLWIGGRVRDSGSAAVSGMRTRSVSSIFLFFFAQHEVKVILRTNGLAVRNI